LNLRSLVALVVAAIVIVACGAGLQWFQNRKGSHALLVEARARLEDKQTALALGYLNRYLELNSSDTDALELKGKILGEGARTEAQVQEAANVLTSVIGRDENRREARRLLVKTYLKSRSLARAAEAQARELIKRGGDDAEAHRLLARALEQIGDDDKNASALEEARKEYETAEKKEPSDVEGAERLAYLYREHLDKPEPAQAVLDHLVEVTAQNPKTHAAALLARARHYTALRQPSKAEADIDRAIKDDPQSIDVRLVAAENAVAHRDTATARVHLKAIDPEHRDDLRVKIAEGSIDLAEQRPDDAIQTWRAGLVRSSGNDVDLTFNLAYVLLQVGRVSEAETLVEQYRRLSGGETPVPRAHFLQGLTFLKKNLPTRAIAELEPVKYKIDKAVEGNLFFTLGQAYETIRDETKAMSAYQRAAELARDWSGPWLAIAKLQAPSNPSEAISTVRRGLALNPTDPAMHALLLQLVWRREALKPEKDRVWDEFNRVLNDAKKAAPGAAELAIVEAEYLIAHKRPEDAVALLDVATRLRPRSSELWLARANALARLGKLAQGITVTEQAVTAAGPQAGFYTTRASLLVLKGEIGKAKDAMVEGLGRVPREQRSTLWKALGDFYRVRQDDVSARAAYQEWAKLQPDNAEPRLSLFDIALTSGDEKAIEQAIAEIREVSGPKAYYWRLARIEALLRARKDETPDPARDASRLDQAETLVAEIQADQPQLPLGFILEGRVKEARKQVEPAIKAYEKALKMGGGTPALNLLVALLVREHREADLNRLRESLASLPGELDPIAAAQVIQAGNKNRAAQLVALALEGDPKGWNVRTWQTEVFGAPGQGKPEEAEAALKLLTAKNPTEAGSWIQLFMLQLSRREADKAAATIVQIRDNVKVEKPELLWAACYRASGDIPHAIESYQTAVSRWPDDVRVLTSAITFFDQVGRRDDAEAALRSILRRDKSNGWATRTLAQSLANRAGNSAAWEEALKLIGPEPRPDDVADDTLARAAVYAQGPNPKHREQALSILEGLITELPTIAVFHDKAARLLLALGRLPEARDHAAKAAASDRADPDAIQSYAGILLALNDITAAEAQLDRLAAQDPDGLPVADLRSKILVAKGKPREAAEALEHAFDLRASTPEAFVIGEKMVRLLSGMNQPEAAERVARKLAEHGGPKADCLLAETLVPLGKLDPAATLLEQAARSGENAAAGSSALTLAAAPGADPRWIPLADRFLGEAIKSRATIDLLQKQAILRHFQKKFEQEVVLYHSLIKMKPDNYLFLNNMAWTLSEDLHHPELGRQWADEAIKKAGDHAHIRDTRGVILTRLGDYDAAIKDLEIAARNLPTGAVYYHLARALIKAKKPEEARKWRDLARKAGLTRDQLQPSELVDWDDVMKS
jgi:tetratricopeptide (TPR) repeat protein